LWLQVRKKVMTPDEAREGLALLRAQVEPTPTAELALHDLALDIGLAINHSTYDTLYVAFAIAVGAAKVVVADRPFVQAMRSHPDPIIAGMVLPLDHWARAVGMNR
jgi:predicted nucleic acid-binding protein